MNRPGKKNCQDAPSGQVLLGIRQFNNGEWFECHETFEALWLVADGELRNLYQGIIQLAIALHHWRNGNYNGAMRLLEGAQGYLAGVASPCLWIDVEALKTTAGEMYRQLEQLGQDGMGQFAPQLLPKIQTVSV